MRLLGVFALVKNAKFNNAHTTLGKSDQSRGYDMNFDEIIKKAIAAAGSQRELADFLGESESNMSKMIKGKRPIPAEGLRRLAVLLNDRTTPGQIWEAQQAARAQTEEERQLWLPFLSRAAIVVMTLTSGFCVTYTAESQAQQGATTPPVFIM